MSRPLIVVIGPSGSGKSAVANVLQKEYSYDLLKTVTTRKKRDAHDADQIFVDEAEFESMRNTGMFFGELTAFGARYGLPKFQIDLPTVLLLRAPVVPEFLTGFPDAFVVEIDAAIEVLRERLLKRDTIDRFDPELLTKEIEAGRQLAHLSIDASTLSPAEIAAQIINHE